MQAAGRKGCQRNEFEPGITAAKTPDIIQFRLVSTSNKSKLKENFNLKYGVSLATGKWGIKTICNRKHFNCKLTAIIEDAVCNQQKRNL